MEKKYFTLDSKLLTDPNKLVQFAKKALAGKCLPHYDSVPNPNTLENVSTLTATDFETIIFNRS